MNEPSERARAAALDQRRMMQIANQRDIINRLLGQMDNDVTAEAAIANVLAEAAERAAVWQARYEMATTDFTSERLRHIQDTHPLPELG